MTRNKRIPPEVASSLMPLFSASKSQIRKFKIIEASVKCYAKWGEGTTFDHIAKESQTSRPLLLHYFKTKDELILLASQYVRAQFQQRTIDSIKKGSTSLEMLDSYLRDCFMWVEEEPDNASFHLFFMTLARNHKKFKKLNDEFVETGKQRIAALLERAFKEKSIKKVNFETYAKFIQSVITGALIQLGTESMTESTKSEHTEFLIKQIFSNLVPSKYYVKSRENS